MDTYDSNGVYFWHYFPFGDGSWGMALTYSIWILLYIIEQVS